MAFNHNPASAADDALNIREDYNTPISVPEYVKGGQNKPAAYIKDTAGKILVRLKVEPSAITSMKIKGVSDDTEGSLSNLVEKTVTFSNGISQEGTDDTSTANMDESEYVEFALSENTTNAVFASEEAWKWRVAEVNGTGLPGGIDVDRTAGHRIYVVWDAPKAPWNQAVDDPVTPDDESKLTPWVKALEFTIETAGGHNKDDTGALAAITSYLHTGHGLKYDIVGGGSAYHNFSGTFYLTSYIEKPMRFVNNKWRDGEIINCYDQAGGVFVLSRLLGCEAGFIFFGQPSSSIPPFGYIYKTDLVGWGDCNNPFPANVFELCLGQNGITDNVSSSAPARSPFGNHAFVDFGGNIYDACAGPHLGTESLLDYCSASIDISSIAESNFSPDGTLWSTNQNKSFSQVEVDKGINSFPSITNLE